MLCFPTFKRHASLWAVVERPEHWEQTMRHCFYLKVWYRRLLDFFALWCRHFGHLLPYQCLFSPFSKGGVCGRLFYEAPSVSVCVYIKLSFNFCFFNSAWCFLCQFIISGFFSASARYFVRYSSLKWRYNFHSPSKPQTSYTL